MWEARYILLLWLSIIVMIPFDLSLMDGGQQSRHHTLERILRLAQHYILLTDKSRDAAALLLSRCTPILYLYLYLLCFVVCLTLLASFFLPSSSLYHVYTCHNVRLLGFSHDLMSVA